jgi:hypothetical protein
MQQTTSPQASVPSTGRGPIALSPQDLAKISGAGPNGGWAVASAGPNGGWA